MARSALITGITGQDGCYLAQHLAASGYRVHGLVRDDGDSGLDVVRALCPSVSLVKGDLLDLPSLVSAVQTCEPGEVYNLAAVTFAGRSFEQSVLTGEVTGIGAGRMLEAIRTVDPTIRFFQASSSEMFGVVDHAPQSETTAFHPRSPYGVAKVYAHLLTGVYRRQYGMFACAGILFNHESPRRGTEFVTRKITNTAARIKRGVADELVLGNLDSQRDWGFAGDYVRAMHMMMTIDAADDLVIATGEVHTVREFCELAFGRVGLDYNRYVVSDPRFWRPAEEVPLVGDASKAMAALSWRPEVGFGELVAMMVDADLAALDRGQDTPAID